MIHRDRSHVDADDPMGKFFAGLSHWTRGESSDDASNPDSQVAVGERKRTRVLIVPSGATLRGECIRHLQTALSRLDVLVVE